MSLRVLWLVFVTMSCTAIMSTMGGGLMMCFSDMVLSMVSEMVQNSQSLNSFTFSAVIVIHEYIYSHSTTKFTFKKYIYSHLKVYFLFTIIFTHIYEMSSFTFNALYSFTFTIKISIQHFLRTTFAHH